MVRNERLKLLANALDWAFTAAVAIGIFGPFVTGGSANASLVTLILQFVPWLLLALLLHGIAQAVMGTLRP